MDTANTTLPWGLNHNPANPNTLTNQHFRQLRLAAAQ